MKMIADGTRRQQLQSRAISCGSKASRGCYLLGDFKVDFDFRLRHRPCVKVRVPPTVLDTNSFPPNKRNLH